MAKYLAKASYTQQGLQGLLKDGGTKRRQVVEKLAASVGGKMEAFYFAFGDTDLYAIMDAPDNVECGNGLAGGRGRRRSNRKCHRVADARRSRCKWPRSRPTYTAPGQ